MCFARCARERTNQSEEHREHGRLTPVQLQMPTEESTRLWAPPLHQRLAPPLYRHLAPPLHQRLGSTPPSASGPAPLTHPLSPTVPDFPPSLRRPPRFFQAGPRSLSARLIQTSLDLDASAAPPSLSRFPAPTPTPRLLLGA